MDTGVEGERGRETFPAIVAGGSSKGKGEGERKKKGKGQHT